MDTLTVRVDDLTERMERLAGRMDKLEKSMDRLEERMEELASTVTELTEEVAQGSRSLSRVEENLGTIMASELEQRFNRRAPAYVGRFLRGTHVLSSEELLQILESAEDRGVLSEDERMDVLLADSVVQGRRRDGGGQVFAVVEVSWGVGMSDVSRALQRAGILAKVGLETMPLVAGESITTEADLFAQTMRVPMVRIRTDGGE